MKDYFFKISVPDHIEPTDISKTIYDEYFPDAEVELIDNTIPQWISVKDRLPEDGQICFITNCNDVITAQYWAKFDDFEPIGVWAYDLNSIANESTITHWMPMIDLPEPPKE